MIWIVLIIIIIVIALAVGGYFVYKMMTKAPQTITPELIKKLTNDATNLTEDDKRNIVNGYIVELIRSFRINTSSFSMGNVVADTKNKNNPYQYSGIKSMIGSYVNYDDIITILKENSVDITGTEPRLDVFMNEIRDSVGTLALDFMILHNYFSKLVVPDGVIPRSYYISKINPSILTKIYLNINVTPDERALVLRALYDDIVYISTHIPSDIITIPNDGSGVRNISQTPYPYRDFYLKFLKYEGFLKLTSSNLQLKTYLWDEKLFHQWFYNLRKIVIESKISEIVIDTNFMLSYLASGYPYILNFSFSPFYATMLQGYNKYLESPDADQSYKLERDKIQENIDAIRKFETSNMSYSLDYNLVKEKIILHEIRSLPEPPSEETSSFRNRK